MAPEIIILYLDSVSIVSSSFPVWLTVSWRLQGNIFFLHWRQDWSKLAPNEFANFQTTSPSGGDKALEKSSDPPSDGLIVSLVCISGP